MSNAESSNGQAPSAPVNPGTTSPAAPEAPPAREQGSDWTQQVTDLIVDTVDKVRAKTTGPILEVARGTVLAIVAFVLVIPVVALGMIFLIRLLDWAIPGDVWIVYSGLGIIFVLVGVVLWKLRTPRDSRG